jgi:cytochrome c-type biogenesis protein
LVVGIAFAGYALGGGGQTPAPTDVAQASPTAPVIDEAKVAGLMEQLQANPNDTAVLLALADEFYAGGQYETAATWLDKLLAIDPEHVDGLLARGAVSFNLGDSAAAATAWNKVLALEPDNQEAHFDLRCMTFCRRRPTVRRPARVGQGHRARPDHDPRAERQGPPRCAGRQVHDPGLPGLVSRGIAGSLRGHGRLPGRLVCGLPGGEHPAMNELGSALGLAIAFLGGVVSFASPCCLPLVPAYIAYMVGATGEGTAGRRVAFRHGLAFVAGFSAVFVAFYAIVGAIGLVVDRRVMTMVGGALLVFLGLQVAGVINVRALWRDTRAMPTMGGGLVMAPAAGRRLAVPRQLGATVATADRPTYTRSLLFGLLFAAGWSPCIGPILGGILGLASATSSVVAGTVLLVAYAAGLAVPFLAVALGASWVSRRLAWVGRHHHAVSLVTGVLLVTLGVLMLTNMLGRLATFGSPLGL